jgi:hypothetical protein
MRMIWTWANLASATVWAQADRNARRYNGNFHAYVTDGGCNHDHEFAGGGGAEVLV